MQQIGIAALGTYGDVAPFVELGRRLRVAGHHVRISTTQRFKAIAEDAGLDFRQLPGDPSQMFEAVGFDPSQISPWRPLGHLRLIHRGLSALIGQTSEEALLADWQGVDFALFSPTTTFVRGLAQRLGAPCAMIALTPSLATGAFSHPVLAPLVTLGRAGNRVTWLAGERLQRQTYKEPLKPSSRKAWGLPWVPLETPRAGSRWPPFPIVHAYSGAVAPRPADWPAHVQVTGWIFPERSSTALPHDVEQFLRAGDPPLYVGFGSMPMPRPERTAEILVGALERTGNRAIVSGVGLAAAASLRDVPSVLVTESVAHDRVFDHVKAVIHHGGSGTVGTGLRAARPTLVIPMVFDQFFWGSRVRSIGAGPRPLPFHRLSVERLSSALAELESERIRVAARRVAENLSTENGIERALEVLDGIMR